MKENSVPRAQMRWTQSKYLNTQRRDKSIVDSKHAILQRCQNGSFHDVLEEEESSSEAVRKTGPNG